MQKRFTAGVVLLLALALSTASVSGALQGAASITKPDSAALKSTDEILKVVSRLRALDIKQNVKSSFKTKEEIKSAVIKDMDESTPREDFEASQKTLVKLGLIGKSFDLRRYHDTVLLYGPIPVPAVRQLYLAGVAPSAEPVQ